MTLALGCVWLCNSIIKWNRHVRLHARTLGFACERRIASTKGRIETSTIFLSGWSFMCMRNCTSKHAHHCSYSPPRVRQGHRTQGKAYAKISSTTLRCLSCRYTTECVITPTCFLLSVKWDNWWCRGDTRGRAYGERECQSKEPGAGR